MLDYAWPEPDAGAGDHHRLAARPRDRRLPRRCGPRATSAARRPTTRPGCTPPPPTEALAQLDAAYDAWSAGVLALDEGGLARPCGEAEGPYAAEPLAALVLHINREMIHHGAEICLLRDLYPRRKELS